MKTKVMVDAKDDSEALNIAIKELSTEAGNIEVQLIRPARKFMGKTIGKSLYECRIKGTASIAGTSDDKKAVEDAKAAIAARTAGATENSEINTKSAETTGTTVVARAVETAKAAEDAKVDVKLAEEQKVSEDEIAEKAARAAEAEKTAAVAESAMMSKVAENANSEKDIADPEKSILDTDSSYDAKVEKVQNELKNKIIDGDVKFIYTEDGVFINIRYAVGGGNPVTIDMVNRKIKQKKLRDVNVDAVKTILAEKKTGGRIAEPQEEYAIDEMIEARFSLDKMIGYIMFYPAEGGKNLEYEDMSQELRRVGITTGIIEENVRAAFDEREYEKEYKVAEGTPAIDGENGVVTVLIDFKGGGKPEEIDNGYVDYYSLGKFISVKQGEVLATYKKPTKGKSGRNVQGEFLKAVDGKGVKLPLGRNTMLSDDGTQILSKVEGVVEQNRGTLNVDEVLLINGDVDLSTGNIEFSKNVKVRGSIRPSMTIKAGGSIEVDGIVESATLDAKGKINIRGGIQGGGKGKGLITAGGDITAQYIENATIYCDGDISSGSIVNSDIECAGYIDVRGQKASIIGGNVKSALGINCQNCGSSSNIKTKLEVGILPKIKRKVQVLEKEINELIREARELRKVNNLDDSKLDTRQKLIKLRMLNEYEAKSKLADKKTEEMESLKELLVVNKDSYISVADVANAGTTIVINSVRLYLETKCMGTTFRVIDGEIEYTMYTPVKRRDKDKKVKK